MFSFDECVPNRPPRSQKLPLDSGTVQLDTPIGRVSTVTSMMRSICRFSKHSLAIVSPTTATKFRCACVFRPPRTRRDRDLLEPVSSPAASSDAQTPLSAC